jgi:hypothetical protein
MLKHFVLTRIGLGVSNPRWFEETVPLLEAVTCASLASQTSQDFTWCLVADVGMPAHARARLEGILAARPNFHLVMTDVTRMTHMHLGGHDWVYEPCRTFMLERALVANPLDYIITSVIDADDAWHRDFVATVNAHFGARLPELMAQEQRRGPHLQHSAGAVATFPLGLQWFAASDALEPMTFPFHSTSVSVAARFSSGVSAWSCRHALWPSQCAVLNFDRCELDPGRPMWVYVRHQRTDLGWDARQRAPAERAAIDDLGRTFGIDLAKVARWRAAAAESGAALVHEATPIGAHYDRIFTLTALNRQIEVLERRLRRESVTEPVVSELLARQRVARDALLAGHRGVSPAAIPHGPVGRQAPSG